MENEEAGSSTGSKLHFGCRMGPISRFGIEIAIAECSGGVNSIEKKVSK